MKEYFCILGGGGIRGMAYTGAIKALNKLNIKITGYAGSSIGAVVAGLLSVGYTEDEVKEQFENINFDFFKDLNLKFGKDFALSKGENFYKWSKNTIEKKVYGKIEDNEAYTFSKLKNELVILAVDLTTSKIHEFSKTKTPNVEIAQAIRISVGMPGLYAPVINGGECLVDGDLSKGSPLFLSSSTIKNLKEKILEFRLEDNERKRKVSNTAEYLNAVYDAISGFSSDFLIKRYGKFEKYDLIKLNMDEISVVDFMASKEKKEEMVQKGYDTTLNYFENIYPEKEKEIKEIKTDIEYSLEKFKFLIDKKSYINARYELNEVFPRLISSKYKINEKFITKLLRLKDLFNVSLIEKDGFFGKKPVLINPDETLFLVDELKKELI